MIIISHYILSYGGTTNASKGKEEAEEGQEEMKSAHRGRGAVSVRTRYVVYIVKCADWTLYTGSTNDVVRRAAAHNEGTGAKYTRGRLPVRLVYVEKCTDKSDALKREAALKRMSRTGKQRLVNDSLVQHNKATPLR